MSGPAPGPAPAPEVREIADAREEAQAVSSELLDVLALHGTVSRAGPGVALYGDLDPRTYYRMHHPWSVTDVPEDAMRQGMERLRAELPGRGWTVRRYGRDTSPRRNLELLADRDGRRYAVAVRFTDLSGARTDGEPGATGHGAAGPGAAGPGGTEPGTAEQATAGPAGRPLPAAKSRIFVDLVSACYRVPEGRTVDAY